jgi:membrane-associated phospholipid phosphatase
MEKHFLNGRWDIKLRFAEKILLAFFVALLLASLALFLPPATLATLAVLNVMAGCLIVALTTDRLADRSAIVSPLRDWLPALLILLAYHESGLFIKLDPAHRLDHRFIQWDQLILHSRWVEAVLYACAPWLQYYLELCYLLCYPLVPFGFAALYFSQPSRAAQREVMFDEFWTAVLLAILFCYAIYPMFPLTPPRVLFNDVPGPPVYPLLRHINHWVLDRFSVQVCLFPSGHTAAVTATALAVREYRPRLGILFCIVALSIAAATVYGRYHYLADAVAGVIVGVSAFAVSRRIHKLRR